MSTNPGNHKHRKCSVFWKGKTLIYERKGDKKMCTELVVFTDSITVVQNYAQIPQTPNPKPDWFNDFVQDPPVETQKGIYLCLNCVPSRVGLRWGP